MEKIPDEILEKVSGGSFTYVTVDENKNCPKCGAPLTLFHKVRIQDVITAEYYKCSCGAYYLYETDTGRWTYVT